MNTIPAFLTPSEFVYLNGEKFAPKGGVFNTTSLIHMDYKVSEAPLAQAVVAAAFMTLEQQGTLHLEIRQKKVMLGLASSKALYADAVGQMAAWPAYTLEAALPGFAYQLAGDKGRNEVRTIVYAWLGQDSNTPYEEVFNRVKYGLALRGLLETRQETRLKIFKTTSYVCPPATRQLAAAQTQQPVQQLVGWYQQARPEIYSGLFDQIRKGIEERREQTDTSSND